APGRGPEVGQLDALIEQFLRRYAEEVRRGSGGEPDPGVPGPAVRGPGPRAAVRSGDDQVVVHEQQVHTAVGQDAVLPALGGPRPQGGAGHQRGALPVRLDNQSHITSLQLSTDSFCRLWSRLSRLRMV